MTRYSPTIDVPTVTSGAPTLDLAWTWLCRQRRDHPPNADIWDLRFHWPSVKDALLRQLRGGTYRLSPMQCVGKLQPRVMWSSTDALALKWLELNLAPHLPVHRLCEHLKGHGGGPTSIQRLKTLSL